MVNAHQQHDHKEEKPFGSADPILPYAIGGGVFGLLIVFMLTVGRRAVPLNDFLAVVALGIWFVVGVFPAIIYPVMIGVSITRKRKFLPICGYALLGIVYFVISGVLMANFSLPIQ